MTEKTIMILSIVGAVFITAFLQAYNYIPDGYIMSTISIVINYLIVGTILSMITR